MTENTKIEWADHTFNPWMGCTKVGPGCDHCYAENQMDTRWGKVAWGPGKPRQRTSDANWRTPPKWDKAAMRAGKPARVFCASLADVLDHEAPDEWREDLWQLIRMTPNLIWMLLTKRIGNAERMIPEDILALERVWVGATICNQVEADRDIQKLLALRMAGKRFVSYEPAQGPVDFRPWLMKLECGACGYRSAGELVEMCNHCDWRGEGAGEFCPDCGAQNFDDECPECGHHLSPEHPDTQVLNWIICGGESGPGARPMHPDWARSVRDQCAAAGVAYFFKQWGEWVPSDYGTHSIAPDGSWAKNDENGFPPGWVPPNGTFTIARLGKKAAGRLLDGREHNEFPRSPLALRDEGAA